MGVRSDFSDTEALRTPTNFKVSKTPTVFSGGCNNSDRQNGLYRNSDKSVSEKFERAPTW